MKNHELEVLVDGLESRADFSAAELDGAAQALAYLRPDVVPDEAAVARSIGSTDGAMLMVDKAYPGWSVNIHGRANDRDGHWRCVLRESDSRDNDRVIGAGRSPVLSQAILAALLRLAEDDKRARSRRG